MTLKERIAKLKSDNYIVQHKSLGDTKLYKHNWIRIFKFDTNIALYLIYVSEIDTIAGAVLEQEVLKEECYVMGLEAALDLYVK